MDEGATGIAAPIRACGFAMTSTSKSTDSRSAAPQTGAFHDEALQVLVAAHYVLAGITVSSLPVFLFVAWTGWDLLHPERGESWSPRRGLEFLDPLYWGAVLYLAGGALATLSVVHAGLLAYIGRCIARRRRRLLCLIFSTFDLTYMPLGTTLSVFALVLLTKQPVKEQFAKVRSAERGVRSSA
jgi:hypothetical protein